MTSTWKNTNISPSPGFCVKSKLLHPGFLNRVALPQGLKVFVNVAWSKDVPPPLNSVKKTLELATATSTGDHQTLSDNGGDIPIYIFVSDGRLDTDKAGNPSVVFDCIYHSLFKSHVLKDADVKKLLIEHALKQIEVQNSFSLSRTLGKPNITSKGTLEQRIVSIPAELFPKDRHRDVSPGNTSTKRLVEEVPSVDGSGNLYSPHPLKGFSELHGSTSECPSWTWTKEDQDIFITIQVPRLTHATIASATLDVEPRRLTLVVPGLYGLDIDLNLSDSALGRALFPTGTSPQEVEHALLLKRDRNLDVEAARAEWRRKEGSLVIMA
ncbi:PIH1 family [Lactarius pseudohatsudake]|nr:PIH1 family [Lactarius pseudohatsudake]